MSALAEIRLTGPEPASEASTSDDSRPARWVFPLGRWHHGQSVGWHVADAVVAVGLLGAVMTLGNLDHMPQGLMAFLSIHISVKNLVLLTGFGLLWPAVMMACGLYAPGRLRTGKGESVRLLLAGGIGSVLALVFPLTSRSGTVIPLHAIVFGMAVVPAAGLLRAAVRVGERVRRRARPRHLVLVGSGPLAAQVYRQVLTDPAQGIEVVGFVDSEPQDALRGNGAAHLGRLTDLEDILMRRVVDDVLIVLPVKSCYEKIRQAIAACARVGVPASYSVDLFGSGSGRGIDPEYAPPPVLSLSAMPSPELLIVKRAMDLVAALVLLVMLAPVMAGVALAVKLTSRGPVLFTQYRYGYMKRLFRMHKFRTMVADAERMHAALEGLNEASGPAFKIRNDPRVTPIGRFLRRTSLDELPQIWHVLTGQMSLVGPRPMSIRDVNRFPEPWLMRRFSMRPGLTCLWQISDRSDLNFDRWIAQDLEYISRWSLWLDLRILIRTLPAVIRGSGAM